MLRALLAVVVPPVMIIFDLSLHAFILLDEIIYAFNGSCGPVGSFVSDQFVETRIKSSARDLQTFQVCSHGGSNYLDPSCAASVIRQRGIA